MKNATRLTHSQTAVFLLAAVAMVLLTAVQGAAAVSDTAISDTVSDELKMDMAVPSYRIDVATNDGIVTLDGTVDNILAKERAARVAETVKGVRAVVNTIKVSPSATKTDSRIQDDVRMALAMDSATDSYEVAATAHNNVVTLSGTVDSWQEKELCATVAKGVSGVTGVQNNIQVDYKVVRSDREIKQEIEKALHWDTLVDDALLEVNVNDGRVALSGTLGSAAEKTQAVENAYVAGVKDVDAENVRVRLWARKPELRGDKYSAKSDAQIRMAVKDAMLYDPRVMSFNVRPEVKNKVVTLRGEVGDLKAKRAAEMDARHTVGVWRVENRLKVRPIELQTDETIQNRAEKALLRDPYVESFEITVVSQNGIVDLYGTVDTFFEKLQSEDVVSAVPGVIAVENNIVVSHSYNPYAYDPYVDGRRIVDYPWYAYQPFQTTSSDRSIEQEINSELFWSPFVDADQVEVNVDDGVATLNGRVDSWSEYSAANENAFEGGAVAVNNNLIVK